MNECFLKWKINAKSPPQWKQRKSNVPNKSRDLRTGLKEQRKWLPAPCQKMALRKIQALISLTFNFRNLLLSFLLHHLLSIGDFCNLSHLFCLYVNGIERRLRAGIARDSIPPFTWCRSVGKHRRSHWPQRTAVTGAHRQMECTSKHKPQHQLKTVTGRRGPEWGESLPWWKQGTSLTSLLSHKGYFSQRSILRNKALSEKFLPATSS